MAPREDKQAHTFEVRLYKGRKRVLTMIGISTYESALSKVGDVQRSELSRFRRKLEPTVTRVEIVELEPIVFAAVDAQYLVKDLKRARAKRARRAARRR